jgi:hypothetical protein
VLPATVCHGLPQGKQCCPVEEAIAFAMQQHTVPGRAEVVINAG